MAVKAEIQIVPIERALYLRIEAETPAELLLLGHMEYWSPTFDLDKEGKLQAKFDMRKSE